MSVDWEDQPLFPLTGAFAPRPKRPPTKREEEKAQAISWVRYSSPNRAHCYRCIELRADGEEVPLRRAAWVRRHQGVERLLCVEHEQLQRLADSEEERRASQ